MVCGACGGVVIISSQQQCARGRIVCLLAATSGVRVNVVVCIKACATYRYYKIKESMILYAGFFPIQIGIHGIGE